MKDIKDILKKNNLRETTEILMNFNTSVIN
jgi:hypothetical protein